MPSVSRVQQKRKRLREFFKRCLWRKWLDYGRLLPMASDPDDIEYLANVFLSGFTIRPEAKRSDVWQAVETEMKSIMRTMDDKDAVAFERTVKRLIVDQFEK